MPVIRASRPALFASLPRLSVLWHGGCKGDNEITNWRIAPVEESECRTRCIVSEGHGKEVVIMVLLFVLITFLACITVDYLLSRRRAPVAESASAAVSVARAAESDVNVMVGGVVVPAGLYYHPGHTWAAVEEGKVVRVGLDDFARRLSGPVEELEPPPVGRSVRQGHPVWTLNRQGQKVAMLSPVDGVVEEINPAILKDPNALREDPYGAGWVARIRVAELGRNLRNLLHGSVVNRWMEDAVENLHQRFALSLGTVMADGGILEDDLSEVLSESDWAALCQEYFLSD